MSNLNAVCPSFPVERYAVELLNAFRSPVLTPRLELIQENLSQVIEHYEFADDYDSRLMFVLDTLSSSLTISITVLRYKTVDRKFLIDNIVSILRFIADNYSFNEHPEFHPNVPNVPRETLKPESTSKRTAKKV